jgi:hypothetical protein
VCRTRDVTLSPSDTWCRTKLLGTPQRVPTHVHRRAPGVLYDEFDKYATCHLARAQVVRATSIRSTIFGSLGSDPTFRPKRSPLATRRGLRHLDPGRGVRRRRHQKAAWPPSRRSQCRAHAPAGPVFTGCPDGLMQDRRAQHLIVNLADLDRARPRSSRPLLGERYTDHRYSTSGPDGTGPPHHSPPASAPASWSQWRSWSFATRLDCLIYPGFSVSGGDTPPRDQAVTKPSQTR